MALADIAGDLAEISLISPEAEFMLKALSVEEPFTHDGPTRHETGALLAEFGVTRVRGAVAAVDPAGHEVELADGARRSYDSLIVCVGGRARPRYESAETFWPGIRMAAADALIERADSGEDRTLAVVVPPGVGGRCRLTSLRC